jgi:hypothetical protein
MLYLKDIRFKVAAAYKFFNNTIKTFNGFWVCLSMRKLTSSITGGSSL